MSRHAAPATRWHGRLRQLAAALLLVALGAFLLQATARPGAAVEMAFDDPAIAAVSQGCDHSQPAAGDTPSAEPCGPAESAAHGGYCHQICSITALLPQAVPADGSPDAGFLSRRWPDQPGRTPARILRPPRFPAAA